MTGYNTYADGQVLVADDLNGNLQQGFLRYTNKTARDADLTGNLREGMVAYTTADNTVSYYDGSGWNDLTQTAISDASISTSATGSATIDGVDYDYWTYTSSGNFVVSSAGFVDVLAVGGGGGGAAAAGGGGGAGGVNFQQSVYVTAGTVSVVVGAGGQGATTDTYYAWPSFNGNSSAFGSQVIAVGGGGSGAGGNAGGSSGGSSTNVVARPGTPTQGNQGGVGQGGGSTAGGGGGGAAANGQAGSVGGDGGDGGDGLEHNMNGTPTYYGGGGGGGGNADLGGSGGSGGLGGGGNGATGNGTAGSANTGGGGGAGGISGGFGNYGANGGSGIVIIRVPQ